MTTDHGWAIDMSEDDHEQSHARYMAIALEEGLEAQREGNVPVGAVIVRAGSVIGRGHNEVRSGGDPTAHAEVQAIRDACCRQGDADLSGTSLYTTMEPCPMCCWAIVEAGVDRLVLGARHAAMRKHGEGRRADYGRYSVETLLALAGRRLDLVTGVRESECEARRSAWTGVP